MTTRIRLPRLPEKRQGFSIIELMTVVFIIALMASASFAIFKNFRVTTSIKVAARDVVNIMRLARRKAITERENYLAVYDLKNEKVWVQSYISYTSSGLNPDFGTEQSLPEKTIIARVKSNVADGRTGIGDPISTTDDYAESGYSIGYHKFTPKSTAPTGSVWLRDKDSKIKYRVTVINTTARARIYDSWED